MNQPPGYHKMIEIISRYVYDMLWSLDHEAIQYNKRVLGINRIRDQKFNWLSGKAERQYYVMLAYDRKEG